MKKKNIIKIIIGVVALVVIGIVIFWVIKSKSSDTVRLGMTEEEFIYFCERKNYEYTRDGKSTYHIDDEFSINGVNGIIEVHIFALSDFDENFEKEERVNNILFKVKIDENESFDDFNKKVELLDEYLSKLYVKKIDGESLKMYMGKGFTIQLEAYEKRKLTITWMRSPDK